jgi:hypothetical protein
MRRFPQQIATRELRVAFLTRVKKTLAMSHRMPKVNAVRETLQQVQSPLPGLKHANSVSRHPSRSCDRYTRGDGSSGVCSECAAAQA